jgi:hypothetical protein
MLWALSHGTEAVNGPTSIPTCVFVDDWQTRSNFSHARTLSTKRHYLSKPFGDGLYFDSDPQDVIQANGDVLLETARLLGNEWPQEWLAVCPMYSWGDHRKVLREIRCAPGRITYLDPSPHILDDVVALMQGEPLSQGDVRLGEWTLPALMPHQEWVERCGVRWPVTYFGSRKLKAERLKTEHDVIREVARREGLLSPKYHHTGSGWWRSRFIYAAALGIVLGADPSEAGDALGEPYQLTPRQIEELSQDDRNALADAQVAALMPRLWTSEQWYEAVRVLPDWASVR